METHYLVEAKEAQVTDHGQSTDSGSGGDFAGHLQANLHNLQRVGKDHLRASSLGTRGLNNHRGWELNVPHGAQQNGTSR